MHERTHTAATTACPPDETRLQWLCDPAGIALEDATHLTSCPACRQALADWAPTLSLLRTATAQTTPDPALRERILAATTAAPTPSSRRGWLLMTSSRLLRATAAAALLVLCLGAGLLHLWMTHHPSPTPDEAMADSQLQWLDHAQSPDGSWRPDAFGGKAIYTEALTGLTLMGYATDVHQPSSQRTAALTRAVDFLRARQHPDGRIGTGSGDAAMYNHTMATLGLIQICDRLPTRIQSGVREATARAIAFTEARQMRNGGWGYIEAPEEAANAGVTSWAIQTLMEAREAGYPIDPPRLARGVKWLDAQLRQGGTFSYRADTQALEPTTALTAMGALCLLRSNHPLPAERRSQLHAALEASIPGTRNDMYGTYLLAAALDAAATERCGHLLATLKHTLASRSQPTSHDRWHEAGGDLYATSLACLTLRTGSEHTR